MQRVERSIRIQAPIDEVYEQWRNFHEFPRYMEHVHDIQLLDERGCSSRWVVRGPLGFAVSWDARLTEDEPGRAIAWNSTDGGNIKTSGSVTFTPTEHNTVVNVIVQWFDPPGGRLGEAIANLVQDPGRIIDGELRRFKEVAERRHAQPRAAA